MLTEKQEADVKRLLKSAKNSIAEGYGYNQVFSPKEVSQLAEDLLKTNDELVRVHDELYKANKELAYFREHYEG